MGSVVVAGRVTRRRPAGEPRAEGATRVPPAALGRVLGLDRAPEVKTIRRREGVLARWRASAMTTPSGTRSPETSRPGGGGPARQSAERSTAGVSEDPPLPTGIRLVAAADGVLRAGPAVRVIRGKLLVDRRACRGRRPVEGNAAAAVDRGLGRGRSREDLRGYVPELFAARGAVLVVNQARGLIGGYDGKRAAVYRHRRTDRECTSRSPPG